MSAINALFTLACGHTLDGCHDSSPGWHFAEHGPGGLLWCDPCQEWEELVDVVSLIALPKSGVKDDCP